MYSFFCALCPSGCIARNASRRPHVEKLWNAFIPFSSLSHTRYQQKDDCPDHRCSLRQHNVWDILGWRILNMITTHGATESIWCWWINYYPRVGVFAAALGRIENNTAHTGGSVTTFARKDQIYVFFTRESLWRCSPNRRNNQIVVTVNERSDRLKW